MEFCKEIFSNKENLIDGPCIIRPDCHYDKRGYFLETYSDRLFKEKVADATFYQDNLSYSEGYVARGLHWQLGQHAQAKLVQVLRGRIFDIIMDIRTQSPTFKEYAIIYLDSNYNNQLYIPRGFAHGYVTLTDNTLFSYKCDNYYCIESECGCDISPIIENDIKKLYTEFFPDEDIHEFIRSDKDMSFLNIDDIDNAKLF